MGGITRRTFVATGLAAACGAVVYTGRKPRRPGPPNPFAADARALRAYFALLAKKPDLRLTASYSCAGATTRGTYAALDAEEIERTLGRITAPELPRMLEAVNAVTNVTAMPYAMSDAIFAELRWGFREWDVLPADAERPGRFLRATPIMLLNAKGEMTARSLAAMLGYVLSDVCAAWACECDWSPTLAVTAPLTLFSRACDGFTAHACSCGDSPAMRRDDDGRPIQATLSRYAEEWRLERKDDWAKAYEAHDAWVNRRTR